MSKDFAKCLVVRRGQAFKLDLLLNRPFDINKDAVSFIFYVAGKYDAIINVMILCVCYVQLLNNLNCPSEIMYLHKGLSTNSIQDFIL